jgi:HEAT repeat protein
MRNLQIGQVQALARQFGEEANADFIQLIQFLQDQKTLPLETIERVIGDESMASGLREVACWVLGKIGSQDSAPALVGALNGPRVEIAEEAARSLGLVGGEKALHSLLDALQREPRVKIRAAAAYALGLLGNRLAIEPLLQSLANPLENARVRGFCAESLARFGDRRASAGLMAGLSDRTVDVRFWSAFALGELKEPSALTKLKDLAERDAAVLEGWGSVQEEAAGAIDKIRIGSVPQT